MNIFKKTIYSLMISLLPVLLLAEPTIDFSNAVAGTFIFEEDDGGIPRTDRLDLKMGGIITGDSSSVEVTVCNQFDCNDNLLFSGLDVNGFDYSIEVDIFNGKDLAIIIPGNYFGTTSFEFRITDDTVTDGTIIKDTLIITVNPQDDLPILTGGIIELKKGVSKTINFLEDTTYFKNYDGDVNLWSIESIPDLDVEFTSIGVLHINTPSDSTEWADWDGEDQLTIKVKDLNVDGLYDTTIFILQKSQIAEYQLPETFTINEDDTLTFNFDDYIDNYIDESLSLINAPDSLTVSISHSNKTIEITNGFKHWNGTEELIFTIFDNETFEYLNNDTVQVTITAVDDQPEIKTIPVRIINEDVLTADSYFPIFNLREYLVDHDSETVTISWDNSDSLDVLEVSNSDTDTSWGGNLNTTEDDLIVSAKPHTDLVAGATTSINFTLKDNAIGLDSTLAVEFRINQLPGVTINGAATSDDTISFDEDNWTESYRKYQILDASHFIDVNTDTVLISDSLKLPFADTLNGYLRIPGYSQKLPFSNYNNDATTYYVNDSDNDTDIKDTLTVSFSSSYMDIFPSSDFVFTDGNIDSVLYFKSKLNWNGIDTLLITTNDGYTGIAVDTILISVESINDAPWFSATPYHAQVNQAYSFTLEPQDKEDSTLDLTIDGNTLPEWLHFDGEYILSGTPTITDTSSLSISVTDKDNATTTINKDLIVFPEYEPPITPELFAYTTHAQVILSWDTLAIASVDSVTGYRDFEGFKIYRSMDRGSTWCSGEEIIRDDMGDSIACTPYAQFDLGEIGDMEFVVFENDSLTILRNTSISGYDPYLDRVSLGNNSGLTYSFVDENIDVLDGLEYTYTLTAYDTGVRNYDGIEKVNEDGFFYDDTTWSTLNPDSLNINGTGFQSLESPFGSNNNSMDPAEWDINYITIVPGKSASNITYPDTSLIDTFVVPATTNIGNGKVSYAIIDEREIDDIFLQAEIKADTTISVDSFEGYATENPKLFIYQINDLDSLDATSVSGFKTSNLSSDEIDSLKLLPGMIYDGNDSIKVPDYLIEDFPIMYLDDYAFYNNWTEILSGVRFRFDNSLRSIPDDKVANISEMIAYFAEDKTVSDSNEIDTTVTKYMEIDLLYFSGSAFNRKPPYEYRIEFFGEPQKALSKYADEDCDSTYIPFRIKNLITNKYVQITHDDKGVLDTEGLTSIEIAQIPGRKDCYWGKNENIIFSGDSVRTKSDITYHPEYTFELDIDWEYDNLGALYQIEGIWDSTTSRYDEGEIVRWKGMLFEALDTIKVSFHPNTWVDDGSGGNLNPWQAIYPWEKGHYIDLKPTRWYKDGDSWTVNLNNVGKVDEITEKSFKDVKVVPNPYIVHSDFENSDSGSKLRFINLPDECRIKIYTVSGEFVDEFNHQNINNNDGVVNSGSEWWDLNNGKGDMIAPGLYIYMVESIMGDYNHIGKFAVVR